jgi:formylglycine-generating enzyme required for sulfatase activity
MFDSTAGEIESAVRLDRDGALSPWRTKRRRLVVSFRRIISQYIRSPISNLPTFVKHASFNSATEFVDAMAGKSPGLSVANVSWFGAQAYCLWAGLRLPTEIDGKKRREEWTGESFRGDQMVS